MDIAVTFSGNSVSDVVAACQEFARLSVSTKRMPTNENDVQERAISNGRDVDLSVDLASMSAAKTELLSRYPSTANLISGFIDYLLENEPAIQRRVNKYTITLVKPGAWRAGLRLRATWLWLYGIRGGQELKTKIASEGDFAKALQWIRDNLA